MTKTSQLHVILGATGGVGQALVQELAAQGAQVRAVNRSGHALVPAGVEVMAATFRRMVCCCLNECR
jgi:uncharacterized protein YbjT (DUF2867 family)